MDDEGRFAIVLAVALVVIGIFAAISTYMVGVH